MKKVWILLVLPLFFYASFLFASNQIGSTKDQPIIEISLVELLANPERFHGKFIRVEGFLRLEFEGNGLYLSRDDANYLTRNVVWVDIDPNLSNDFKELEEQFSGKFVLIEGVFDKDDRGHMGLFSGAVKKISRILELQKRHDF